MRHYILNILFHMLMCCIVVYILMRVSGFGKPGVQIEVEMLY